MSVIHDSVLGDVNVRRHRLARSFRATVDAQGALRVTVPYITPLFLVKRQLIASRKELKALVNKHPPQVYKDGMTIGKSHTLLHRIGNTVNVQIHGQQLIVTSPNNDIGHENITARITPHVIRILRKEAKHHLPRRLAYLAEQYGFSYTRVRFSHASSRWGSCSSNGTISLNIALMNLPFELIDYVLLHELAHTVQMNHSTSFWDIVQEHDPQYKLHRKLLKQYNPHILIPTHHS